MGMYSFSFWPPPIHPRLLPAPPGGKKEPTATFGREFERKKYTRIGLLKTEMDFGIGNSVFGIGVLVSTP